MNKKDNLKLGLITILILSAALSRLLPHPPNFTPIAAMALFGGVYFTQKRFAFIIPVAAMVISDLFIGFHKSMWAVYLGFCCIAGIGFYLKEKYNFFNLAASTLISSVIFYLLTNFAVWLGSTVYLPTFSGLILCYEMGIPFFRNSLTGDIAYTALLFGAYYFAEKRIPLLSRID